MAKLYFPGSKELFGPLKGVVDFYYYKGQLCARRMPIVCHQPGTQAQQFTWAVSSRMRDSSRDLTEADRNAWRLLARVSQRTWYDVFASNYMTVYHKRLTDSGIIYDVQMRPSIFGFQIGMRSRRDDGIELMRWRGAPQDKPVLWWWDFERAEEQPPNCRRKVVLKELWPEMVRFRYSGHGALQWGPIVPLTAGQVCYFYLRRQTLASWLPVLRTGVFVYER